MVWFICVVDGNKLKKVEKGDKKGQKSWSGHKFWSVYNVGGGNYYSNTTSNKFCSPCNKNLNLPFYINNVKVHFNQVIKIKGACKAVHNDIEYVICQWTFYIIWY